MIPSPPAEAFDALYLNATLEKLGNVLRKANFEVSYFRKEIESLTSQQELPIAYRQAYGRIVALLATIEQAIGVGESAGLNMKLEILETGRVEWSAPEDAELITAVQETIAEINRAETRLHGVVESARKALLEHADPGLIDWTMRFEYEFSILFDHGPTRRFYETCCDDDEPMRVSLGCYLDSLGKSEDGVMPENWNIFEAFEKHPLNAGHHGYLMHCILEHSQIPWQLLPSIREIEVSVEFRDTEAAWKRPDDIHTRLLPGVFRA